MTRAHGTDVALQAQGRKISKTRRDFPVSGVVAPADAVFPGYSPGLLVPFADAKHPAADQPLNMRPNFLNVCFNALTLRWGFDDPKHPIPQNNKVRDHV